MPDILLCVIIAGFIVGTIALLVESGEPIVLFVLTLPMVLSIWVYEAKTNNKTPYEYGVYTVQEIEGTAVIKVGDKLLNVNEVMKKNVKDGTKVKVSTYQQLSGGIFHCMTPQYDLEILE